MIPENLLNKSQDCLEVCVRECVYGTAGRADFIRDVMGLANLSGDTPRYLIIGAKREEGGAISVTGLEESALVEIESYPGLVKQYLEPQPGIQVEIASMQGKLVAVVQIDHCNNPPYMVCTDLSHDLKSGACWIREPGLFRSARRADLDRMFRVEHAHQAQSAAPRPGVIIGFGEDPAAQQLAVHIPELRLAPSVLAARRLQDQISVVKAAGERDVADSSVARLVHAQQYGSDQPYDERGVNTLIENFNAVPDEYLEADQYYYRESNALKLNFCIQNTGEQMLENLTVVLTFPCVDEFKVVDSLCPEPGRSQHEQDMLEYPEVSFYKGAAQVRQDMEELVPGKQCSLFESALRIALLPAIAGKKIAIRYALHARGLNEPQEGVLKLLLKR